MAFESPDPLRTLYTIMNLVADLRRIGEHHPEVLEEVRKLAESQPEAAAVQTVLASVTGVRPSTLR